MSDLAGAERAQKIVGDEREREREVSPVGCEPLVRPHCDG